MISTICLKLIILLLLLRHVSANDHQHLMHHRASILQEKATLLAFKNALPPQSQANLDNWNKTTDVCSFVGVDCNKWRLHVTHLSLAGMLLSGPIPPILSNLTGLHIIDLSFNAFTGEIPIELGNLPSLSAIDLSYNNLRGVVPRSFSKLSHLQILDLGDNGLVGEIPASIFWNCTNLEYVDLHSNALSGEIPPAREIYLSGLRRFVLYLNNFTGRLPSWLSNSTELAMLDVADNSLFGELPIDIISNKTHLWFVDLSRNNFWSHNGNTNLEPFFKALSNCTNIKEIEMASIGLGGKLPTSVWSVPRSLTYISLENNIISGQIPQDIGDLKITVLDLSSNQLDGPIPTTIGYLSGLVRLIFSNNSLTGPIPLEITNLSHVAVLDLSNNFFNGTIEQLTCRLDSLTILNLAENNLSGNLPRCWPDTLEIVNIAHNKLSGLIPSFKRSLNFLWALQLNSNSLTGEFPSTLQFCRGLTVLDIGDNNFFGQIPEWIGESLNNLIILRLRSNMFSGKIPDQIMHLTNLQVLDVASNHISGLIPLSLDLWTEMTSSTVNKNIFLGTRGMYYTISTLVVMKGSEREYTTTLSLLRSIDLSGNNLIGEIPQNITTLLGLINLNLSNNHLHGSIPAQIGQMQSIESLDLSINELSGMIPWSLSNLNFLTTLNLSYNNFSGKIPTGNQLQTIDDPYNYIGNDYLCGPPLIKSCNTYNTDDIPPSVNNDLDKVLSYLFVVLGFGFGFWVICGTLLFKPNWRYCFFQVVDNGFDRLYVFVVVYGARMRKYLLKRIWRK